MSLRDALKRFIEEEIVDEDDRVEISHDDPLIERGIIDSMAVMQIVTFIEEETGLRIPDSEVLLENFESVSTVDAMVQRLSARTKGYGESAG